MSKNPIIIAGIPIPFHDPTLLAVLAVHILAGLICVITGIVAMVSKKGPGRHPLFGTIYYHGLFVLFVTAMILAAIRWREDYYLGILGPLAFTAASLGRAVFRSHGRLRVYVHISGMGLSYTLMLVAFYMDNGRNLPLWRDLPSVAYWIAPGASGAGLIIYTLLRYTGKR